MFTLIVGLIYLFDPPRDPRYRYGYRTKYTLMNQENWDLGHKILTVSYMVIGLLCFIGVAPIVALFNTTIPFWLFIVIIFIQMLMIVSPFIYTPLVLRQHTIKYNLKNEHESYIKKEDQN